jgi:aryl-alcohol dehydrogenase-like predicted oxidoreductase
LSSNAKLPSALVSCPVGAATSAAQARGLGVTRWSPLAGGLHRASTPATTAEPHGSSRASFGRYDELPESAFTPLDELTATASRLDVPIASLALAWVRQQPHVTATLIRARTIDQLEANLASLTVEIPAEEVHRLDEMTRPQLGFPSAS